MTDYLEMYKAILQAINDYDPSDDHELIDSLSHGEYIKSRFAKNDPPSSDDALQALRVLENVIDDGLVNGTVRPTDIGSVYTLRGLTTSGHEQLHKISDKKFSSKLNAYMKENGIPTSIKDVSKLIATLIG